MDEKPQHGLCTKDADSCCGFRAKVTGEQSIHKHPLPETVKPVYRDLTDTRLLGKCLKTPRLNEFQ
jgi:hypothetical protein